MIAQFHIPSSPLNHFINHFFYYTGFSPAYEMNRFLPDGEVQIIFDLTEEPKFIYDNDSLEEIQACKKVWFSGFRTIPITIPSGRENEMLIVQFEKGKAYPFLKNPMNLITNQVVDAELVVKAEVLEIREKLLPLATAKEKFIKLEKELIHFYFNHLEVNPFVEFAVSKISQSPNQHSIKEIAEKVGFSQKHMINIFKKHVGVRPKEFLKVIRFQRVIQRIEANQKINWAGIAHDCGYYDQSHFIADFKKFSGFTPRQYLAQKGEFLNYVPIEK